MRILSLNVNNFSGYNCKKDRKKYDTVSAWRQANKRDFPINSGEIIAYIRNNERNIDIVILHEFELNTTTSTLFANEMEKQGFNIVSYPNPEYTNSSITGMFIKDNIEFASIENPHRRNLRASIIKVPDQIIYGVHCPIDMRFWDELINFYTQHREEELIIIGDFNVFDCGTPQKEKYLELLNLGAKDIWIEKCYPHEKATFTSGKRIDYAFMSPLLFNKKCRIEIDDTMRVRQITDHSAIFVEW